MRLAAILWMILLPGTALAQAGPPGEVINSGRVARAITPSDTVDLALGPTRFVWVTGAGGCALAVILADDAAAVTITPIAAGTRLDIRAKRVMATNTTCTGTIGLW